MLARRGKGYAPPQHEGFKMMMRVIFWGLSAIVLLGVLWGVFQGVKGIGAAEVAVRVEAQRRIAVEAAARRAAKTQQELTDRAEQAEAEVTALEQKLAGVRDVAAKGSDDFIVFGNDWAEWLRGSYDAKPGQ